MPRIVYVNGQYCLPHKAALSFQDRGFQFGDGIYGVMAYYKKKFVDYECHIKAIKKYCEQIDLDFPVHDKAFRAILKETVRRNHVTSAHIYVQITRGQAPRRHHFPDKVNPTLVVVVSPWVFHLDSTHLPQIKVVSSPDIRWRYSDIKSTSLLPTVLLREKAHRQGAFDAWLTDNNGHITEGASSNAYIVTHEGVLVTRPYDGTFIPGVTRARLLTLAQELNIKIEERYFTLDEVYNAAEAFISGATSLIKAVSHVDHKEINGGRVGPVTQALSKKYFEFFQN